LRRPEGVFVTDDPFNIYIADTGNRRIVKLDQDGNVLQIIERPESPFIPSDYAFYPIKLVVDNRGFLYIASMGGYQGLLQLDPNGEFVSFFGANTTEISSLNRIMNNLKNILYTKEMKENQS